MDKAVFGMQALQGLLKQFCPHFRTYMSESNSRKDCVFPDMSVDVIGVVWHHKAKHVQFPRTSRDTLVGTETLRRCLLIVDAFYFNHDMYSCEQNEQSLEEVMRVLEQQVPVPVSSGFRQQMNQHLQTQQSQGRRHSNLKVGDE